MATPVQYKAVSLTTNGTSRSLTLDTPPTPGNRLVFAILADKNKTITPPAGFDNVIAPTLNTSLSYYVGTRVVQAGDSSTITATLSSSTNSASRLFCWEVADQTVIGGSSHNYSGETPTLPEIASGSTGALPNANGLAIAIAGIDSVGAWANGSAHNFTNGYGIEDYNFTDPASNSGIPGYAVGLKYGSFNTAGESTTFQYTREATNPTALDQMAALLVVINDAASAATLSGPSPSGTLTTQGQVTLGMTTNQTSGTVYAVLATSAAALVGIEGDDIDSGLLADGVTSAPFSGSASVSDTTPEITITGLAAATTYYAAIVQVNSNGTSNVVTTSFTTAASSRGVQVTLKSRQTGLFNGVTMRFFTRYSLNGAAIDGGADGLEFTSNASGVFSLYGLTINAGPGYVTTNDPNDPTRSINIPVNFVSAV